MKWRKLGQIFHFKKINDHLLSHASNPVAIPLSDNIFRIFFSSRNMENRSSVGYFDFDIALNKVSSICSKEIFKYGDATSFYSHGVSIGCAYYINTKCYIPFMGWQIKAGNHWRGDIGRLRLINTNAMTLEPQDVFIGTDIEDQTSLSYPFVLYDEGRYKMWYGSTIDWTSSNGEMVHVIKYATSQDGTTWTKHGLAIPYEIGIAQAFSRPTVIKNTSGYHMWFSYRSGNGTPYRIGYAHSKNGISWNRLMNSGIDVSDHGWDSQMICYPYVICHDEKYYMFYNGNDYGKYGIGLAILEY